MSTPAPEGHHFETPRTARFYTIGSPDATVNDLWFALHGYGQLAGAFAANFAPHRRDGRLVVVPEALSRFYVNNQERIMGASWMTAEDRKMEIRDYVRYLNALYRHVIDSGVPREAHLTVLAFSQGTATATRWLAEGEVSADRLVLWGGIPAFELCNEKFQTRIPVPRIQMVTGTKDRYTSPDRQRELVPVLSKNGNPIESLVFEGPHRIDREMLGRLMDDGAGASS